MNSVTSNYRVEITFHGYSNPTGRCDGCRQDGSSAPGCCDQPSVGPDEDCIELSPGAPVTDTCDTSMEYCIRELGSTQDGCSEEQLVTSPFAYEDTNDMYFIAPVFFGLDNPLIVTSNTSWTVSCLNNLMHMLIAGLGIWMAVCFFQMDTLLSDKLLYCDT